MQRPGFEQRLFCLFARGVVGTDQQITDDCVFIIAKSGNRNDRRKSAAILANISQFVDVLDPTRSFKDQGFKTRRDRGSEFQAQRCCASDQLLRIGDIRRRDRIHHFSCSVAQHALGADIKDLNNPLLVGRDTREVSTVENRDLQRPSFKQGFFCSLPRGHIFHGQNEQFAVVTRLELASVEEHDSAADHRERVLELEIVEDGILGDHILKQRT